MPKGSPHGRWAQGEDRVQGVYRSGKKWRLRWYLGGELRNEYALTEEGAQAIGNARCAQYGWPIRWPGLAPADVPPGPDPSPPGARGASAELSPAVAKAIERAEAFVASENPNLADGNHSLGVMVVAQSIQVMSEPGGHKLNEAMSKLRALSGALTALNAMGDQDRFKGELDEVKALLDAQTEEIRQRTRESGRLPRPVIFEDKTAAPPQGTN